MAIAMNNLLIQRNRLLSFDDGDFMFTIADVKRITRGCNRCGLRMTRKQAVLARSEGLHFNTVVFVGEAPGADEDKEGSAFVGASGHLLDNWIKRLGIANYYITNIVRCRPPGNRKPHRDEINECFDFLGMEINILKPVCIVALGKTAETELGKSFRGIPVFAIYHPSYYLRLGNHEEQWGPAVDKLKENISEVSQ